ncbi:MAG: YciI family protein [Nocardioidaceae bacterium]
MSGATNAIAQENGKARLMKFVILIHSNPQPWGHPTSDYIAEHQALPQEKRAQLNAEFEAVMTQMQESGELLGGEALGDPASATLYRWDAGKPIATDGPYAESKEQFAGFFLIDVASRERAEEIAAHFSGPGETVELRPAMWPGGDDQ